MFKPKMKRRILPSGKPLVPDYTMTYQKAASKKPFGRVWWDEMAPTVITRAKPYNHRILHPSQNRVLSNRENARIQGFPDHYRLYGSPKERYIQVGNAVAVAVARALGYCHLKDCLEMNFSTLCLQIISQWLMEIIKI